MVAFYGPYLTELLTGRPVELQASKIQHHFAGDAYAKEVRIEAGQVLVQHRHKFDHLSVLAKGTVDLMVDGELSRVTGPACLTIKAGQHHAVKAVTDVVWYCIHATDCTDPEQIDHEITEHMDLPQVRNMARALKEH